MNKIVKILLVFVATIMLYGCGWDDVSEFPEFKCTYEYDSGGPDGSTGLPTLQDNEIINRIAYSKTTTKLYASYSSSKHIYSRNFITNDNGSFEKTHYYGDSSTYIKYENSDFTTVSRIYETTGKCPELIKYKGNANAGYTVGFDNKCTDSGNKKCYQFKLVNGESSNTIDDSNTYTCSYSINGLDFRVDLKNISGDYVSSKSSRQNANDYYLSGHVITSYKDSNGQYVQVNQNKAIATNNGKVTLLTDIDGGTQSVRRSFFILAFNNMQSTCPTLYLNTSYNPDVITTEKVDSIGNQLSAIPEGKQVCYDSNGKSVDCSSLGNAETQLGDTSTQKTCEYTSNDASQFYKIIVEYNKSATAISDKVKLKFNGNGTGLSVTSNQATDSADGYQYITDTNLIDTFNKSIINDTISCPAYIYCDCKVNAVKAENKKCTFLGSGEKNNEYCGTLKSSSGQAITNITEYMRELTINQTSLEIPTEEIDCDVLLGNNLLKVVHLFITILRIGGAILAIIKAMMALIPAITSKDADALKKAGKTCVIVAIILCVIGIFPSLVSLIAKIGGFDPSCL